LTEDIDDALLRAEPGTLWPRIMGH
jgi:hypothetical protein